MLRTRLSSLRIARRGGAAFERAILVDRTMAGLARARAQGKRLGRPATSDETISRARELRATGMSMDGIARALGIGKSVAQRVCQGVAC